MPPHKLKGKDYSSDVILQSNKNQLIYQVRANTYDFWLSSQYGKYNSNIFLFHDDALPLNSLFWSPPTAVHRFDASDMAVPGLNISWPNPILKYILISLSCNSMRQARNSFRQLPWTFDCYQLRWSIGMISRNLVLMASTPTLHPTVLPMDQPGRTGKDWQVIL